MAWRLANSLVKLRDQVNAKAPNRSKASDGTIGDPSHQAEGTGSDHNPNKAGVVNAFDITHDPAGGMNAAQLAEAIIASRDNRVKYLIFNRRAVEPGRSGWSWQPYTGSNPHTSHLHVSVGGDYDNSRDWNIGQTNQGDDDVTRVDFNMAKVMYAGLLGREASDAEAKSWVGQPVDKMYYELFDSPERADLKRHVVDALFRGSLQRNPGEGDFKTWQNVPLRNQVDSISGGKEASIVADEFHKIPNLKKEIETLKSQVGKNNDADPNDIVITQKGWGALGQAIRSFFSKNN